jgi:UDP-glucose:(heptosyl)LPS alpha-1,3-glucosyltransferase
VDCLVIHVVKRFGRVGGMESYVWHLVHGLVDHGMRLAVVCEQVCESPDDDRIQIVEVKASPERPRWRSMLAFRARVDQKIQDVFSGQSVLIHSHERSLCHQVTTFHGPPIEPSKGLDWLSLFNKRFNAWLQMERDELLGTSVQMVLPVSSLIKTQLINRYPEIEDKTIDLAWPGVDPCDPDLNVLEPMGLSHVRFLFVGKEWKRKGLDIAVRIVKEFRKSYPGATLTIFGVEKALPPRSIRGLDWVIFQGWASSIPWSDFDLLLHPARKEPFGMVVSEARSRGLPVVMSSQVGAGDLNFSNTKIVELNAPPLTWCRAVEELFETKTRESELKWSWGDLVLKHIEKFYPQLQAVTL